MSVQPDNRKPQGRSEDRPLLEVRGLRVLFRDVSTGRMIHAVDDATFDVPRNTFVGLTGESGSGKTTIALSLMGLGKGVPGVVAGAVRFDGRLVYDAKPLGRLSPLARARRLDRAVAPLRGRDLFMIFQEPRASLNPYWKIGAQLAECLHRNNNGLSPEQATDKMKSLLAGVWLPPSVLGMYPAELSTGMCQRIMIAMALAMGVKLLVADEPLSRIDLRLRRKVVTALDAIRGNPAMPMSMLLSTHDLDLIKHLADMVIVMYKGRIIEIGPTPVVLGAASAHKHEYTARLLATYNWVESARGQIAADGVPKALDAALLGRLRRQIPLGREMVEVEKGHWLRK